MLIVFFTYSKHKNHDTVKNEIKIYIYSTISFLFINGCNHIIIELMVIQFCIIMIN